MAQKNNAKEKGPNTQGSDKKGRTDGLLHGLLTVLLSILIVLVVFGGAFYYVLKNNLYGLGESFRPSLERIPVIKLALPPLPETADPYDPKHLTQKELLTRYNQLRNMEAELSAELEKANERISQLENEKHQWESLKEEAEAIRLENEKTIEQINKQTAELEAERKELSRLIAQGNKDAFLSYFERIDPQTSQEIYRELTEEKNTDQKYKSLAKSYAEMAPANAAAILSEIGAEDMPMLINLISAMKTDTAAEIIENMDPKFAAELMKKIAEEKTGS
jgi:flagellar motility protein MotE (MotC chaperone)